MKNSVMTYSCARIIHYTWGILVKIMHLALLPHAKTQSPDKTECNWLLR